MELCAGAIGTVADKTKDNDDTGLANQDELIRGH
jgi:hypothetical protein